MFGYELRRVKLSSVQSPRSRENAFDLLRLVAAGLVMASHGWRVFDLGPDPVSRLLPGYDLSSFGLFIFFAVSGYLVGQSAQRLPPRLYARNRLLRIAPGLAACLLVTAFVLGPIATDLPVPQYLLHWETWAYLLNLLLFPLQTELPGVFQANPWADHVNGSLWTLAIEVTAYVLVCLACLHRKGALPAILALGMAAALFHLVLESTGAFYLWFVEVRVQDDALFLFYLNKFGLAQLVFVFMVGAALNWLRRFDLRLALCGLILALVLSHPLILGAAVAYGAIALGQAGSITLRHDLSYGLYLYHLPVMQLVWTLGHHHLPMAALLPVAVTATVLIAALSWWFVERPALSRRRRGGLA